MAGVEQVLSDLLGFTMSVSRNCVLEEAARQASISSQRFGERPSAEIFCGHALQVITPDLN